MRKSKQRLKSATSTIVDFATGGLLVSLCILLRCVRTMRVQAFVASEGARRGISIAASMSTLSWGVLEEKVQLSSFSSEISYESKSLATSLMTLSLLLLNSLATTKHNN